MFARPVLLISIIQAALLLGIVEARIWLLERDGRAIFTRRFGQGQPGVLRELAAACGGGVCDALADEAVAPLLVAQTECSQQDMADKIIDASRQFDMATQAKMIAAAMKYRQAEKNTPPDWSTSPPTLRNSVYCQKPPRNSQLNGLVQAQDPSNNPNLFFDPATGVTVTRGSQHNTFPFGSNGIGVVDNVSGMTADFAKVLVLDNQVRLVSRDMKNGTDNSTHGNGDKTMIHGDHKNNGTNSDDGNNKKDGDDKHHGCHKHHGDHKNNGTNSDDGSNTNNGDMSNGDKMQDGDLKNDDKNMGNCSSHNHMHGGNNKTTDGMKPDNSTDTNNGTVNAVGDIGNFGSCSVPEIQFAAGFDGRRETSFEPVDKVSYNHGSAQNIDIITQFMCDQLVNTCKADSTAQSTCARAKTAADGAPPKTGKQADAFNAVFGKVTNFSSVTPLDDQGNPIAARSLRRRLLDMLGRADSHLEYS